MGSIGRDIRTCASKFLLYLSSAINCKYDKTCKIKILKIKMISPKLIVVASLFVAASLAAPQAGVCPGTGLPWNADANTVDANGCTVGYCSRVCPTGAITNDGRFVTNRGNKGSAGTGSNGNAGPVNAAGFAVDPAAETYKKQIAAYQLWAERQQANAARDIDNQNRIQANIPQGNAGPA